MPHGAFSSAFQDDTISINHNWVNGCNLANMWRFLQQELQAVQQEVREWKDSMPDWHHHCQVGSNQPRLSALSPVRMPGPGFMTQTLLATLLALSLCLWVLPLTPGCVGGIFAYQSNLSLDVTPRSYFLFFLAQVIMKACTGINFEEFYHFLKVIAEKRLLVLRQGLKGDTEASIGLGLGLQQAAFDVGRLADVLASVVAHLDFQRVDTSTFSPQPEELLQQLEDTVAAAEAL